MADLAHDAENRLFGHLAAVPTADSLILAGQVVGLLAASECLLALLPANDVAAFCVNLGVMLASSAAMT